MVPSHPLTSWRLGGSLSTPQPPSRMCPRESHAATPLILPKPLRLRPFTADIQNRFRPTGRHALHHHDLCRIVVLLMEGTLPTAIQEPVVVKVLPHIRPVNKG